MIINHPSSISPHRLLRPPQSHCCTVAFQQRRQQGRVSYIGSNKLLQPHSFGVPGSTLAKVRRLLKRGARGGQGWRSAVGLFYFKDVCILGNRLHLHQRGKDLAWVGVARVRWNSMYSWIYGCWIGLLLLVYFRLVGFTFFFLIWKDILVSGYSQCA